MSLMRNRQPGTAHDATLLVIDNHDAFIAKLRQFLRQPRVTSNLFGHQIQRDTMLPRDIQQTFAIFNDLVNINDPTVRGDLSLLP